MSSTSNGDEFPSGVSGPRRSTQEPVDTAAANAAASKLADELGVSSSVRLSSVRRGEDNHDSPASSVSSTKKKGFRLLPRRSNSTGVDDPKDYQAVLPDGNALGVGLRPKPTAPTTPRSGVSFAHPSTTLGSEPFHPLYVPHDTNPSQWNIRTALQEFDDNDTVKTEEPIIFDSNGNRAPYREGPYDYHHDEDGRLIKKRWCKLMRGGCLSARQPILILLPYFLSERWSLGGWIPGLVIYISSRILRIHYLHTTNCRRRRKNEEG